MGDERSHAFVTFEKANLLTLFRRTLFVYSTHYSTPAAASATPAVAIFTYTPSYLPHARCVRTRTLWYADPGRFGRAARFIKNFWLPPICTPTTFYTNIFLRSSTSSNSKSCHFSALIRHLGL